MFFKMKTTSRLLCSVNVQPQWPTRHSTPTCNPFLQFFLCPLILTSDPQVALWVRDVLWWTGVQNMTFCSRVRVLMSQYADNVFLSYDLQWCRFCVCGTLSPLANIVTKFKDCMVIFLWIVTHFVVKFVWPVDLEFWLLTLRRGSSQVKSSQVAF